MDRLGAGCLQFADLDHRHHCFAMVHKASNAEAAANPCRA